MLFVILNTHTHTHTHANNTHAIHTHTHTHTIHTRSIHTCIQYTGTKRTYMHMIHDQTHLSRVTFSQTSDSFDDNTTLETGVIISEEV